MTVSLVALFYVRCVAEVHRDIWLVKWLKAGSLLFSPIFWLLLLLYLL